MKTTKKTVEQMEYTEDALFNISLQSADCSEKEIFIYERYSLGGLIGQEGAEQIRKKLVDNGVTVQQISNEPTIEKTLMAGDSMTEEFKTAVMGYHYVPKTVLDIQKETVIFDDTVAMYTNDPNGTITVIRDQIFAEQQKQLFKVLLGNESLPKVNLHYRPNHSFYNSIDLFVGKLQVIVWPDADAHESFANFDQTKLEQYITNIIQQDSSYFSDAAYVICFIWSYNGEKMVDVWRFNENPVDDRSGPLSSVRVYREGRATDELGISSGNTLLVLGLEERLRRQSKSLQEYLEGNPPELPLDILNRKDFFKEN